MSYLLHLLEYNFLRVSGMSLKKGWFKASLAVILSAGLYLSIFYIIIFPKFQSLRLIDQDRLHQV